MVPQRWLRIIPVALVMYTISYVDRTNVSLALDPKISTMLRDLAMDDRMKGQAAGIFFPGLRFIANGRRPPRRKMERQKARQPVPDFLGRLRRRLRLGENLLPV